MKEKMVINYNPCYNTCVEYYGNRTDILDMLRLFDLWRSIGEFFDKGFYDSEDKFVKSGMWRFEMSKDFYKYAKTTDFLNAMQRVGIKVEVY